MPRIGKKKESSKKEGVEKRNTVCASCIEKDGLVDFYRRQREGMEDRVREAVEDLEDTSICCPDKAIERAREWLKEAGRLRDIFHPEIAPPLGHLMRLLQHRSLINLPSCDSLEKSEDEFQSAQHTLKHLRDQLLGQQNKSVMAARKAEISRLVDVRNTLRHKFCDQIISLQRNIQESRINEEYESLQKDIPELESVLALFPSSNITYGKVEDDITKLQRALDDVKEFHEKEKSELAKKSLNTAQSFRSLKECLQQQLTSLDLLGNENNINSQVNNAIQNTIASCCDEVAWVRRHTERSQALTPVLVEAGYALRRVMLSNYHNCRRLLFKKDYYSGVLNEIKSTSFPDGKKLQQICEKLKQLKMAAIQKKAEYDCHEVANNHSKLKDAETELSKLKQQVQEYLSYEEQETRMMAVLSVTHYPEIPLLYEEIDLPSLVGHQSIDGLLRKSRRVEDYVEEKRMTGGRHIVLVANFCGQKCALKEYNVDGENAHKVIQSELSVLSRLKHPNVISVDAAILELKKSRAYVQMPYYSSGTMRNWLKQKRSHEVVKCACVQVLLGLSQLHAHNVLHCDIKLENVLIADPPPAGIDDEVLAVLCDFDVSMDAQLRVTAATTTFARAGGMTIMYAAPEVRDGQRATFASDLWSYGYLLAQASWWDDEVSFGDVEISGTKWSPPESEVTNESLVSLVSQLLQENPNNRPTTFSALGHAYFTDSCASLRRKGKVRQNLQELAKQWTGLKSQISLLESKKDEYTKEYQTYQTTNNSIGQLWETLLQLTSSPLHNLPGCKKSIQQRLSIDEKISESEGLQHSVSQKASELETLYNLFSSTLRTRESEMEETLVAMQDGSPCLPMYWTLVGDSYGLQLVDETTSYTDRIEELFYRSDSGFDVVRVERIEYGKKWVDFCQYRSRLRLRSQLFGTKIPEITAATDMEWMDSLRLDNAVNEKFLFFSVPSRWAALRMGKSGPSVSTGLFGVGSYFSEMVHQTLGLESGDGSERCIVLARVCLGRPLETTTYNPSCHSAPRQQNQSDLSPCTLPRHDSVIGTDPKTSVRYFVVYDGVVVYPEFLITYTYQAQPGGSPYNTDGKASW